MGEILNWLEEDQLAIYTNTLAEELSSAFSRISSTYCLEWGLIPCLLDFKSSTLTAQPCYLWVKPIYGCPSIFYGYPKGS